ncbi:MAG: hypothetical protein COV99_10675 [Bacteroidetes bacterium CG12_big_fil_rev_8_21_14_0_65_60_17]|nr:MAG: hypothetical protein COV99_10675 [Bacteroidetes bacterium CG12_big_fil_rev_8_21_14_0_65_60_17]
MFGWMRRIRPIFEYLHCSRGRAAKKILFRRLRSVDCRVVIWTLFAFYQIPALQTHHLTCRRNGRAPRKITETHATMSYRTELRSLDTLAAHLPFSLDESERVNETYARYATKKRTPDAQMVDLWTYCYIRRYFLIKFIRSGGFRSSELEQVVESTYRKVDAARSQLKHNDRYAQWVSVVCRNAFYNFVSRRLRFAPLEDVAELEAPRADVELDVDSGALFVALAAAIDELPPFLQPTARMRYVENLSYEEIGRILGKRAPTIRSYIHKICQRFRRNRELALWAERYL